MNDLERRKDHHLDIVLEESVGSSGAATGLGRYTLEYDALPELDLDDVNLETELLGKTLRAPIVIGAMTGGTQRAGDLNRRLARVAERVGVGLALGSQRAMIVKPELTDTFVVRDAAPDLRLLFGNVGAVQLNYGVDAQAIQAAIDAVGADALNLHLNPLQEAVQPEGDTNFAVLVPQITALCEELSVPVLLKEVGGGLSATAAAKFANLPIAGVETAGVGGTSWAKVESFRAPPQSIQATVGRRLAGFGVPTSKSIAACRSVLDLGQIVIGSGGIRSGMDIAVALALGADAVALAAPVLEAVVESEDAAVHLLETLIYELRVICFCTGASTPTALRDVTLTEL